MKNKDKIIKQLERLRKEYEAEGIKVYYATPTDNCIKVIKNGKVVKASRDRVSKPWQDKKEN